MADDVTNIRTMEKYQGDLVLVEVLDTKESFVLTIVHVVDVDRHYLLLVNRQDRTRDSWELTQGVLDNLVRFKNPKEPAIKWQLKV